MSLNPRNDNNIESKIWSKSKNREVLFCISLSFLFFLATPNFGGGTEKRKRKSSSFHWITVASTKKADIRKDNGPGTSHSIISKLQIPSLFLNDDNNLRRLGRQERPPRDRPLPRDRHSNGADLFHRVSECKRESERGYSLSHVEEGETT